MIHGMALSLADANSNVINVTSNIPLLYEDKIDGCLYLKEKKRSFIWRPEKYLENSSNWIIFYVLVRNIDVLEVQFVESID